MADAIFEPLTFRNLTVKNRLFRSNISGRFDNYDGSGNQARINWETKFAKGGVGAIGAHPLLLLLPVAAARRVLLVVPLMEAHAPAAAEDAVIALDEFGERGPGLRVEGLRGVRHRAALPVRSDRRGFEQLAREHGGLGEHGPVP